MEDIPLTTEDEPRELIKAHYYGFTVRRIFIFIGLVMLVTFPFFSELIPVPVYVSIGLMILLAVCGGLINPSQKWLLFANSIVTIIGFAIFEYETAYAYIHLSASDSKNMAFFWINQIISLLFFIALYLSIKTLRGKFIKKAEW
jgi:hypothetical protein